MKDKNISHGAANCIYGLGFIGSLFYFLPHALGFWAVILGILKALVWPAFLVFNLLKFLQV
ncbi:MAG: hypothetical protein NTV03_01295 [Candidatus Nomurabacteria bacterium]|nr:hypothetical protein [Candidatus Nomurabacteria bacterium]